MASAEATPTPPEPEPVPPVPAPDELLLTLNEAFTLERMFTGREVELVQRLMGFTADEGGPARTALHELLTTGFRRLATITLALESYPSLRQVDGTDSSGAAAGQLFQALDASRGHAVEWNLPTKAVLARTFGIAKVNFWGAIEEIIERSVQPEAAALHAAVEDAEEEAVYTRLAEELYGSFAASQRIGDEIKRTALEHALDLWEGRVRFATYRFCPILRSAWAARMRAPRTFGTLMGAAEIVQLLFKDCDERFVDVFARSGADQDMVQAFEEFLFDLPYESLQQVRDLMATESKNVVDADTVARTLGYPDGKLRPLLGGAKALYSSFRRRRVKAQYRTSMQVPGPQRTAESFVLEALLRSELEGASAADDAACTTPEPTDQQ